MQCPEQGQAEKVKEQHTDHLFAPTAGVRGGKHSEKQDERTVSHRDSGHRSQQRGAQGRHEGSGETGTGARWLILYLLRHGPPLCSLENYVRRYGPTAIQTGAPLHLGKCIGAVRLRRGCPKCGNRAAHVEHTVAVTEEGPLVLTTAAPHRATTPTR